MDNKKSNKEERKIELIKEIESNFNFGIKEAIDYTCTVGGLIDYVREDCNDPSDDDIEDWLKNHYDDLVRYIKEGYQHQSFREVVNLIYSDLAWEELYFFEEKIQELLDLVWGSEEDDA